MCEPKRCGDANWALLILVAAVAAVVCLFWQILAVVTSVVLVTTIGWRAVRFVRLPAAAKANWHRALWARVRWRSLARNLALTRHDQHVKDRRQVHKVRHLRARFRPTEHGFEARVRTRDGTGRAEVEKASQHLADAWRCARVSVSQPAPGRLIVRGMRRDPLLDPFGLEAAPAGAADPRRVWLGRDEHGQDSWLELANVSGVVVGGQPGGGKSQAITSWLTQLAPSPAVQFALIDGKGAGEFDDFAGRAWICTGDSVDAALDALERLTGLMYARLSSIREFTGGKKNIWTVGVSRDWPLMFAVVDETQQFLDLPAAKAFGKDAEKACAQAIKLMSELVRKGRSVGMCTVSATQKPTSDSVPSSVSSNCAVRIGFSLASLDAAKATLGQAIGDYPSVSPLNLSLPDHAGVCVASLRDGLVPFTMLRSPMVHEDQALAVAAKTAALRCDPVALLPVTVPDDVAGLVRA